MGHAQNFQYPLFFFNDTATTEIYTLSLHDALPIYQRPGGRRAPSRRVPAVPLEQKVDRSEEHTSELQSHVNLVCRLLLAKIKTSTITTFWNSSSPGGGMLARLLISAGSSKFIFD